MPYCLKCNNKIDRSLSGSVQCVTCKGVLHSVCLNERQKQNILNNKIPSMNCESCTKINESNINSSDDNIFHSPCGREMEKITLTVSAAADDTDLDIEKFSTLSTDDKLQELFKLNLSIKNTFKEKEREIENLKVENVLLRSKILSLEKMANQNNQRLREKFIEIVGVNENILSKQHAIKTAKNVINSTDAKINEKDIKNCFVKNSIGRNKVKSKILCVEFEKLETKIKVLKAKGKKKSTLSNNNIFNLNDDSGKIFINNSFSNYYQALYMKAKKFKNDNDFSILFYKNFKFYLKKNEEGELLSFGSFDEFDKVTSL